MLNPIKKARVLAGFTQNELGEKIGVSGGAVSLWEKGATHPNVRKLKKLADILQVPIEELLEDVEKVG